MDSRIRIERVRYAQLDHRRLEDLLTSDDPAIRLGPFHWSDSALKLATLKAPAVAEVLFRKAEEADPKNPFVHWHWSEFLRRQRRTGEALTSAKRALELLPYRAKREHGLYFYNTSRVRILRLQLKLKQRAEARETWSHLMRVDPGNVEAKALVREHPWLTEESAGPSAREEGDR